MRASKTVIRRSLAGDDIDMEGINPQEQRWPGWDSGRHHHNDLLLLVRLISRTYHGIEKAISSDRFSAGKRRSAG